MLEEQISQLTGERDALQRRLSAERERGDQLSRRLAESSAELATLMLRDDDLREQHRFDERRLAMLGRELGELRTVAEQARGRVAQLESAVAELQDRAAAMDGQVEALTADRERLSGERERIIEERDSIAEERDRLAGRAAEAASTRHRAQALQKELDALRAHADDLRATVTTEREAREEQVDAFERQRAEQRALVKHLLRTEATLQARTDQLTRLLSSRWYRLARSAWQVRRRRPPLGAALLGAIALGGAVVSALLAADAGTLIAGLLGAGIVGVLALGYTLIVPAILDRRVPRLAGDAAFADPLPDETATLQSLLSGEQAAATAEAASVQTPAPPVELVVRSPVREPGLSATRSLTLQELRVAGILDDFSRACFTPECRLNCDFTNRDWRERLEADPPRLLLVESGWAGNAGGWQYGIASYPHPAHKDLSALRELLHWCSERAIPTVFWGKEDPVHFERFKEAAALFDHVFTTDANCIARYEELGGERLRSVGALPFAAQPRLHNPITIVDERRPEPVFAGTYYRNRHADRRASLEMILDAARPFGLIIYDRTFGSESDEYGFPERFLPHVRGRLSYDRVIRVYKTHRVFVNVNSVVDSPTMFSRRVFELLACGTAVLSTESVGMQEMFGDLVPVAETAEDATTKLERLLDDQAYWTDITTRARRLVLAEHTYRDRLAQIAATAGIDVAPARGEEVAALVLLDTPADLPAAADALLTQSRPPDEILLGLRDGTLADRALDRLTERFGVAHVRTVEQADQDDPRERWLELAALASAAWVAPLHSSVTYREHHLRDLAACTRFAQADVIGPAASEADSHRYTDFSYPRASLVARKLVADRGWPEEIAGLRRWFERGIRFYAGEPDPTLASTPDRASSASDALVGPERRRRSRRR